MEREERRMQDLEALGKELQRRGKTGELKKLADSADGQRLGQMLDAETVRRAARSGDSEALKKLLGGVMATEEGKRLAQQLRQMMQK